MPLCPTSYPREGPSGSVVVGGVETRHVAVPGIVHVHVHVRVYTPVEGKGVVGQRIVKWDNGEVSRPCL